MRTHPKSLFYLLLICVVLLFSQFPLPVFAAYNSNQAPDCSAAFADPANLWPPNHKFEPIQVEGVSDPDGDQVTVSIQCILQDEPVNDLGDGNTQWDASGINESSAAVLSERAGLLNGRVYHIDYIATDVHGAQCGGEVLVAVDHSIPTEAIDEGRLYASVPSDNQCGQHSLNNSPYFVSIPVVSAESCNVYQYAAVANDPDRDTLTYTLLGAPEGMTLDAVTGMLEWEEPVEGIHEIIIDVSDNRGGSGRQSFNLEIMQPDLEIISSPVTSVGEDDFYTYDVSIQTDLESPPAFSLISGPAGMDMSSDNGIISWQPDKRYSQGIIASDPYCAVVQDPKEDNVAFADVVAIVDESGSMSGEHRWIGEFISKLEQGLVEQNIGEEDPNLYGLVGFERYPREITVGGAKMGLASEFVTAADQLRLYGGTEDGWRSIKHVIDTYPLRDEGARNLILITDEDRDYTMYISYDAILAQLLANNILLNAVVNARFTCGNGQSALGVDYTGTGYVADGSGGYTTCNNARATSGFGSTISNYVNLALATSGAAWDLNYLRSGGHWAQSFSSALIDIKVKEIVRQSLSLADVTPTNIQVDEEQSSLSVDIVNRGGGGITAPMIIGFFSGTDAEHGVFLGDTVFADGITGNTTKTAAIQVGNLSDIHDVFVQIIINGEAEECHVDNNTAVAPIIGVEVAGECNVSAGQVFAVNVFETNLSPQLFPMSLPDAEADVEYVHTIEADDPNVGDSVSFSLVTAPAGMTINHLSGRLDWLPTKEQEGTHSIVVKVGDIAGLEDTRSYSIIVNYNEVPVIISEPPAHVIARDTYQYAIEATDGDGDGLTYSIISGPAGLEVDALTGLITWVPTDEQAGTHLVEAKVDDGHGGSTVQQWNITVEPANYPPEFTSVPPTDAMVGQLYQYTPAATDPDGDALSFILVNAPEGMILDNTGALYWTPALSQAGAHDIALEVSDGQDGQTAQQFTIIVTAPVPEITFNVDSKTIMFGDSTVLHWTSNNAESVRIDPVGPVELHGSRVISPEMTSTYTLTATGPGGSVSQTLTVLVTYPLPSVNFTSSQSSILAGESVSLSWITTNAESIAIDNGIGTVAESGTLDVSPTATTTYTITASGPGGTAVSSLTIVVTYPEPTVQLTATPDTILAGESAVLGWTTTNADSITIDNGIGPVDASGTLDVSPTATTTYTITASGIGGTAVSSVTIIVTNPEPTVQLTATPDTILAGESAVLGWSAAYVDTVSIDNNIGQVGLEGSMTVFPTEDTTYTITGISDEGTVTHSVTIFVTYPLPTASLEVDASPLRADDSALLTWTTTNADSVTIDPDIGAVPAGGSQIVTPGQDVTYTIIATGPGGVATDTVHIDVYPVLQLQVDSPADGAFTSVPTISVNGRVTEGAGVSVNGAPVPVVDNRFSVDVSLPAMGEHTINVTATDNYGQEETRILTVSYVPELTLDVAAPAMEAVLADPLVEIIGQVSNNASVTVNGEAATVNGDTFTASLLILTEGQQTITITAVDSYGQQKSLTITVYYFNLPTVTIHADKTRIVGGDLVTLDWISDNCESAVLEPGIGEVACSDTISLRLYESTEFVIRSTGLGKTVHASVFVIVADPYGDPTPEEQAHLEAINRARANPPAEAARLNIDLNEGLPEGTISPDPVPPVSFNEVLARAARAHSRDMIDNQYFAHEGSDGSTPAERCLAEGYAGDTGENIAARFSSQPLDPFETSRIMHDDLFIDYNYPGRGHRLNILFGSYKEIGIGLYMESLDSQYAYGGVVTCNFGVPANDTGSVLGVVYEDVKGNQTYDLDEGIANVLVEDLDSDAKVYTASAGGYSMPLANGEHTIRVTMSDGRVLQRDVAMAGENVKLDFRVDMFTEILAPTVYLYGSPQVIQSGETTRLVWESNDAVYAEMDNGIGYVPLNGSIPVSPSQTTTYTITAAGQGTSTSSSFTVYVNDFSIPPSADLTVTPATINKGESAILSWTTQSSADVHIDNGIGAVFLNGSITITPDHSTTYTLTASNESGVINKKARVTVLGNPAGQPAGSFGSAYNYLIPADATLDAYDSKRFSLVTGKIMDIYDTPLAGVGVTILDHPEYGTVYTDNSGSYTLPVQGGATLTALYDLADYLPVQRKVYVPVNDIAIAETVQLLQKDTLATQVVLDGDPSTVIIHKSSVIADSFGARSISMVFQGDNRAYVVDENGNDVQELTNFTTRATEYQTPKSMPAELPETTAYTYCSEMAIDGVDRVRFAKPVVTWVDNFLGFDVGEEVPSGYYDRDKGTWVASQNGIVVELLDTDGDGAVDAVDSDGDGWPDDLNNNGDIHDEALGLSDPGSYSPGAIFWRVEVTHFTPWDYNYCSYESLTEMLGFGSPSFNEPPCPDCPTTSSASAVSDQSLAFYEAIPVPGTDLNLVYASDRTAGFKNVITVPASGSDVPASVKRIVVEVEIAGQKLTQTLPAFPEQVAEFVWDGLDSLGNPVFHKVTAHVRIGFVYDSYYMSSGYLAMSFAEFGTSLTSVPAREEVISWQRSELTINVADKLSGLAEGWTVSAHHTLNPTDPTTLHKGDGSSVKSITSVIKTVAGTGGDGWPIDGADALDTPIGHPTSVAMDENGNLYVSNQIYSAILKIDQNGVVEVIAGGEYGVDESDNISAKEAMLRIPNDLAFDTRGNLYIADSGAFKIRKIDTSGIITTVAGNGIEESSGDKGLAVDAGIMPTSVAVDDFGNIYFAEGTSCVGGTIDPITGQCSGGEIVESSYRIRKVATNG